MKSIPLILAALLLTACSNDDAPKQAVAPLPQAAAPAAAAAGAAQQPAAAAQQQPAAEKADLAAAEAESQRTDPCDLSGYDMKQMTAELHEQLVQACEKSKQ